jgi:hypothetical protein
MCAQIIGDNVLWKKHFIAMLKFKFSSIMKQNGRTKRENNDTQNIYVLVWNPKTCY